MSTFNTDRTKKVLDNVALLLDAPDGNNYTTVCLLSDIAMSLAAIADALERQTEKGEKVNDD